MKISARASRISPFYVMEMAKAAVAAGQTVSNTDSPMVFLNIGEPDFTAPPLVQEAAAKAIFDGVTQYTPALGIPQLRERLSEWYATRFGVSIPASRIVVTAGASAALLLACIALLDEGDEMLVPDPSYPCNRHFVGVAGATTVAIPVTEQERFQLDASKVLAAWGPRTRGVILASPSNPTGTSIDRAQLRSIHESVCARGGVTLIDEIYLGLSFDPQYSQTALALDDQIISINSFSKYFSMTGWRLGWMVIPDALVGTVERLAQNLFICPSSLSQMAALACFESGSLNEYERRRQEFMARRDYFIPALRALGLHVPVMPDGGFYAWADCSTVCQKLGLKDSWEFAFELMKRAHIAVTPGRDFGVHQTHQFIRFSTANSMSQLQESVSRLQALLA
ncbi:MAG: hypothetical protein RL211_212 [Pseudomonadota bacterium]|jgi:aspartate/methionine/tyrosine aminotransferase